MSKVDKLLEKMEALQEQMSEIQDQLDDIEDQSPEIHVHPAPVVVRPQLYPWGYPYWNNYPIYHQYPTHYYGSGNWNTISSPNTDTLTITNGEAGPSHTYTVKSDESPINSNAYPY